jgi:methylated-DNA-[protein]-cysteine S-methyltransferase
MTRTWWDEVRIAVGDMKVEMLLVSDGTHLTGAYFTAARPPVPDEWVHDPKPLAAASDQLQAYAANELTEFDLPLRPATTTYGRVAAEVGRPAGSRAVGAAVGRNPIGIIVPCHRVIGANGSLTGFGGGIDTKVALLRLEGVAAL